MFPHNLQGVGKGGKGVGRDPFRTAFLRVTLNPSAVKTIPCMMANRQTSETFKCLAELTYFVRRFWWNWRKVFSEVISEAASAEIRLFKPWIPHQSPSCSHQNRFFLCHTDREFSPCFPGPSWMTLSLLRDWVTWGEVRCRAEECGCVYEDWGHLSQLHEGRKGGFTLARLQVLRSQEVTEQFLGCWNLSLSWVCPQSPKLATSYFLFRDFLKLKLRHWPL